MNTLARLEELKRNLAQLERKGRPPNVAGGSYARGREADHPGEIPPRGWMDIMWRSWGEISEANLFLIAGGVTYAILLALFPGLAALVSLYGLVLDASQIEKQVGTLSEILPAETQQLLVEQLHKLVEASSGALGIGAAVGVVLALWSASRGMSGLITALNIAYEEKERRGFSNSICSPLASPSPSWWVELLSSRLSRCCRRRCSFWTSARRPNGYSLWCNGPCSSSW